MFCELELAAWSAHIHAPSKLRWYYLSQAELPTFGC